MPQVNWQVRNQAVMHKRNGDNAYIPMPPQDALSGETSDTRARRNMR
jgi:hypothetical protein